MNECNQGARADCFFLVDAQKSAPFEAAAADFLPMRLVLQPSGFFVELKQPEVLIGRHSEADIRLTLPDVSRRHCRFVFTSGQWHLFDLGSLNGIFVNGRAVKQTPLHHGDSISIGGFAFSVDLEAARPTSTHLNEVSLRTEGVLQSILNALPDPVGEVQRPKRLAS